MDSKQHVFLYHARCFWYYAARGRQYPYDFEALVQQRVEVWSFATSWQATERHAGEHVSTYHQVPIMDLSA